MLLLVLKENFVEELAETLFDFFPAKMVFAQKWEFPKTVFTFWDVDLLEYQGFCLFLLTPLLFSCFNPFLSHIL